MMAKMPGRYIVTTVTAEAMLQDEISQDTKMTGDIAQVIYMLKDNCVIYKNYSMLDQIFLQMIKCIYKLLETTKSLYNPVEKWLSSYHGIYSSCEDALARGGIRPNSDLPVRILLSDGTKENCKTKPAKVDESNDRIEESFCPQGMYGSYSKCFTVHEEYVTNMEASR